MRSNGMTLFSQCPLADKIAYPGATEEGRKLWIGLDYNFTDDEGYFTEADGTRSRVIHQYDRFGPPFVSRWLAYKPFVSDRETVKNLTLPLSIHPPRKQTVFQVDISDPQLRVDSIVQESDSQASVLGYASASEIGDYMTLASSLREKGYTGHIHLLVDPETQESDLATLSTMNVSTKELNWMPCPTPLCARPHNMPIQWSRLNFFSEWLADCDNCSGPIVILKNPVAISHGELVDELRTQRNGGLNLFRDSTGKVSVTLDVLIHRTSLG